MEVTPVRSTVAYDVLEKLDIRVGTIERVEDMPGPTSWCG